MCCTIIVPHSTANPAPQLPFSSVSSSQQYQRPPWSPTTHNAFHNLFRRHLFRTALLFQDISRSFSRVRFRGRRRVSASATDRATVRGTINRATRSIAESPDGPSDRATRRARDGARSTKAIRRPKAANNRPSERAIDDRCGPSKSHEITQKSNKNTRNHAASHIA